MTYTDRERLASFNGCPVTVRLKCGAQVTVRRRPSKALELVVENRWDSGVAVFEEPLDTQEAGLRYEHRNIGVLLEDDAVEELAGVFGCLATALRWAAKEPGSERKLGPGEHVGKNSGE